MSNGAELWRARNPSRVAAYARQWFADHREERLTARKADYHRRREAGQCTRFGCAAPAAPGRVLCEPHAVDARQRGRTRDAGRRSDRCRKCRAELLADDSCPNCTPEPAPPADDRGRRAQAAELRAIRGPERGPDGWALVLEYADDTTRSESFCTFLAARTKADELLALVVAVDAPEPRTTRPRRRRS